MVLRRLSVGTANVAIAWLQSRPSGCQRGSLGQLLTTQFRPRAIAKDGPWHLRGVSDSYSCVSLAHLASWLAGHEIHSHTGCAHASAALIPSQDYRDTVKEFFSLKKVVIFGLEVRCRNYWGSCSHSLPCPWFSWLREDVGLNVFLALTSK